MTDTWRYPWLSDSVTGQIMAETDTPEELAAEVRLVVDAWVDRHGRE